MDKRRRRYKLLLPCLLVVVGCQGIVPVLTQLAIAFGQDLLAAASVNYAPRYAVQVESLLAALAQHATGMNFQPQLAVAGVENAPPKYAEVLARKQRERAQAMRRRTESTGGYYEEAAPPPYYETASANGGDYSSDDAYGYPDSSTSDPYATSNPYGSSDGEGPYGSGVPANDNPYEFAEDDPYANASSGNAYRGLGPAIELEVAVLVQRAGTAGVEAIQDGATLHDGGRDPTQGDRLKVHFATSETAFVYVIGIDATGYVVSIFPDPEEAYRNPVSANTSYELPGGNDWWGLDDQKGVEHIYFVASASSRPDIEQALRVLAGRSRSRLVQSAPVSVPAIVPTRGLVKLSSSQLQGAAGPFNADKFTSSLEGAGVVVSRWFYHK